MSEGPREEVLKKASSGKNDFFEADLGKDREAAFFGVLLRPLSPWGVGDLGKSLIFKLSKKQNLFFRCA